MQRYKSLIISIVWFVWGGLMGGELNASNLQITTAPKLVAINATSARVVFDLSWEHSWNLGRPYYNWDAAWVFAKYRTTADPTYRTVYFSSKGNRCATALSTYENTTTSVAVSFTAGKSPDAQGGNLTPGVFISRSAQGRGKLELTDVSLVWDNGSVLPAINTIQLEVFALEMVYVPAGGFTVGSGGPETASFIASGTTNTPFKILNEDAISLFDGTGNSTALGTLGNTFVGISPENPQGSLLPADFPKGTLPYYAMKYELSQEAYMDFLNCLAPDQQIERTNLTKLDDTQINKYVYDRSYRNGIVLVKINGNYRFACNYANDGFDSTKINRSSDGQCIAMNYVSLEDMLAYFDWAGLRPLSELEYEKMCRGTALPLPDEYAWGSKAFFNCGDPETASLFSGSGFEVPNMGNCNGNNKPLRTGSFAGGKTTRVLAGAGFYGNMDLTGNVAERYVSISYTGAHTFTAEHGDGEVEATSGNASSNLSWPRNVYHYIYRGGKGSSYAATSDRYYYLNGRTEATRTNFSGMRGGRTAL